MSSSSTFLIALMGGLIPALLWLWFWLQEDRKHPEPKTLIILTFITGMVCVPIVLPFQKLALNYLPDPSRIIAWAAIEEIIKFGGAYLIALRSKALDEPIDGLIYMITVALGFAALENTMFLIKSLSGETLLSSFNTGNFRFIGATLLHILTSASIGGAIALSFFRKRLAKIVYVFIGILFSIRIHSVFNYLIKYNEGQNIIIIFSFIWAGIIVLILFFEKARRIRRKRRFST